MSSLMDLATSYPKRELAAGETLIAQGDAGGDLFILEQGELTVERDGVDIATIASAGALIGEMSVVLETPASATVRATVPATVSVIRQARNHLAQDQALTFRLAWLMAKRLDATSAVLVDLTRQSKGRAEQQGWLSRIFAALHLSPEDAYYVAVNRNDMFGGNDASRE